MKQLALLFYGFNFLNFVPQKMIQVTPITVKSFVEMLQDIGCGVINLADHTDQLKFFTVHIQCDDGHADILRHILISALLDYPEKYDIVRDVSDSIIKY